MKHTKFSISDVYEILDRHFNQHESCWDIARDKLGEDADHTLVYRICLPKGHHDARYIEERRRFFSGMVPLSIQAKLRRRK